MLSDIFFKLTAYAQHAIRRALGPNASDGPSFSSPAIHVTVPPMLSPQELDLLLPKVCEALVLVSQCIITITVDEDDDDGLAEGEFKGLRAFYNDARSERGEGLLESLLGQCASGHSFTFLIINDVLELLRLLDLFLPRINFGKPVAQVPEGAVIDPTGFSYVKRDLVRLLGILCHRNKVVQDRVRVCGGIPVVMNLCVVDERNPCMLYSTVDDIMLIGAAR